MKRLEAPMILYYNQRPCARIISYGYETPWATGRIEALDLDRCRIWVELCELHEALETWPGLEAGPEDDARWDAALAQRGLTQNDDDAYASGAWLIRTQADQDMPLPGPPSFDRQGFVSWRW